jgi:hypothetical protein
MLSLRTNTARNLPSPPAEALGAMLAAFWLALKSSRGLTLTASRT